MAAELVVAVDVGGTKIAAALVDGEGRIQRKVKLLTDHHDTGRSIDQVAEAARGAVGETPWKRIASVGVAVPGIYFAATGEAWAPNLPGWDRIPLRAALESRLPVQILVDSDRAACVLGEQWLGVAQGCMDIVFLTVGTGIGAGILSGGRLIRGASDIAGAVGWFALTPEMREIYRQTGCWEAEAAGPALARRAGRATAQQVVEAALAGEEAAKEAIEETVRWLAMGIANLISALNPQMVVLGGGLMQAGDLLLEPLRRWVVEWAQPIAVRQARIEVSKLGEDAALLGAARIALEGN
jgi:glucokinase